MEYGLGLSLNMTGVAGADVIAGGVSLLPDLVAGWALTAGPEQTLDSSGVIASGAYDFDNLSSLSFGSSGVVLPGGVPATAPALWQPLADDLIILQGEPWTICALIKLVAKGASSRFLIGPTSADFSPDWQMTWSTGNDRLELEVYTDAPESNPLAIANNFGSPPLATSMFVVLTHDVAGGTVNIQVDNGTVNSVSDGDFIAGNRCSIFSLGAELNSLDGTSYGSAWSGNAKFVRFWKRILTADNLTWIYNSGTGRTDAEVAAYTG